MKAIFNKTGNPVKPKVAELFVKIGIAKWADEPEETIKPIVVRKLTVIEQPKVPNKPKVRKKRTVKAKK